MGCIQAQPKTEDDAQGPKSTILKVKSKSIDPNIAPQLDEELQAVLDDKEYLSKLTDETKTAMAGACLIGKIWTDYWNSCKCDQCDESDQFDPLYVCLFVLRDRELFERDLTVFACLRFGVATQPQTASNICG